MQNEICGQNGTKDMVSFSFEVIFNLYTIITTVTVHYIACPNRTSYFEAPPSVVHLVYNGEITLACRVKHLEAFNPNGLLVHLL